MSEYIFVLVIYLAAVNAVSFAAYGIDKRRAQKRLHRIPEAELLGLAFIGGSVGALAGMLIYRHKTKHLKFTLLVPAFIIIHSAALVYFVAI